MDTLLVVIGMDGAPVYDVDGAESLEVVGHDVQLELVCLTGQPYHGVRCPRSSLDDANSRC